MSWILIISQDSWPDDVPVSRIWRSIRAPWTLKSRNHWSGPLFHPWSNTLRPVTFAHVRGRKADISIEIQHRRDAYDSLVGHLNSIPEPDHPNKDNQVYNTRTYHYEPNWFYRTVSAHWICMGGFLNQMPSIQDAMKSRALRSLSLPLSSGTKRTGVMWTSFNWRMRNS